MVKKISLFTVVVFLTFSSFGFVAARELNTSASSIKFPEHPNFSEGNEDFMVLGNNQREAVKFQLRHRSAGVKSEAKDSIFESKTRDLTRIQSLHTRILGKKLKNQNPISRMAKNGEKKLKNQNPLSRMAKCRNPISRMATNSQEKKLKNQNPISRMAKSTDPISRMATNSEMKLKNQNPISRMAKSRNPISRMTKNSQEKKVKNEENPISRMTKNSQEKKVKNEENPVSRMAKNSDPITRMAKNSNPISRMTRTSEEKKLKHQENPISRMVKDSEKHVELELSGRLMATLESGVSHGSGEYFMDVFIGTPPKHFSLILDTGSDLNWIQCVPCYDCFEQNGPFYDPKDSTSFNNVTCHDPKCQLVTSPDPPEPCNSVNQTCPYYYWYGDSSNTTGDFALETFTVNLTTPLGEFFVKKVENVMFGCGHWNKGLFHGAAGLLGLGRGPLSFSSQLRSLYGHSFSYCLVNRNSDSSVSSKLIFGEDKEILKNPNFNFTLLVDDKETFYYVHVKSIVVGGEVVNIPDETWDLSPQGGGGTIIDSGTTLSYFSEPAYEVIREAFVDKMKHFPILEDFPILKPCYNVSGVEKLEFPSFGIVFQDGAVWNFPVENYFIKLEPEDIFCLAILGTPRSALSIIGNYQQQNFHILYDTKRSRLGYAPTKCADD